MHCLIQHIPFGKAYLSQHIVHCLLAATACLGHFTHASTCLEQAEKPLENSFCEIRAAGGLKNISSLAEFKKNPPNIQRILLKRDAKKLGIPLPEKGSTTTASDTSQKTQAPLTQKVQPSLKHCNLNQSAVDCGASQYALVGNIKNNQLQSKAFSPNNKLGLPQKKETPYNLESDYRYLSYIYPKYIYKMLELGLGDSTMSFTKFAAVYWQNKMEGLDFVERFEFMYNKLKVEKSQNQIKSRYRENYPNNIHQCMRLDDKIIVCDDMKQNWVYRRR